LLGIDVEACNTVGSLLEHARDVVTGALANQELGVETVAAIIQRQQKQNAPKALFSPPQVTFELRSYAAQASPRSLRIERLELPVLPENPYGFRFWVIDKNRELTLAVVYQTDKFRQEDIRRLLANARKILEVMQRGENADLQTFAWCAHGLSRQ
jgi:hypothetical protein